MIPRTVTRRLARLVDAGAPRRRVLCGLLTAAVTLSACTHSTSYDAQSATEAEAEADWTASPTRPSGLAGPDEVTTRDDFSAIQPISLSPVSLPAPVVALQDGRCQAREETPAVYEHVMGEVQVIQANIAADGTVISPPVYRRAPVPKVVRERSEYIFDAVCGHQMTPEFISTLQRALAARGYFGGNVTGWIDAPTSAAIRKYQADRGLDSRQLSLETARSLGLITVSLNNG